MQGAGRYGCHLTRHTDIIQRHLIELGSQIPDSSISIDADLLSDPLSLQSKGHRTACNSCLCMENLVTCANLGNSPAVMQKRGHVQQRRVKLAVWPMVLKSIRGRAVSSFSWAWDSSDAWNTLKLLRGVASVFAAATMVVVC